MAVLFDPADDYVRSVLDVAKIDGEISPRRRARLIHLILGRVRRTRGPMPANISCMNVRFTGSAASSEAAGLV